MQTYSWRMIVITRLKKDTLKKLEEEGKIPKLDTEKNSKYGSRKVVVDDIKFDSQKEANRYCQLKLLERVKEISDLQRQVKFEINPKFKTEEGVVFNKQTYIADFVYFDRKLNSKVIEDVKGYSTNDFKRKWRQMQERYGKEYLFLIT